MSFVSVSVIMPARNAESTLERAIKSTLKALDRHDELLVGLHKSEDSTSRVVDLFSDSRVRVFRYESGKFSDVLNDLVRRSNPDFEFIARMDADDVCLPWRFWLQKRLATKVSGAFLFSSALISFPLGSTRVTVPQYPFSLSSNEINQLLISGNPLNHPTFFGPKKAFHELGGYKAVAGEDLDLWLRASLKGVRLYRSRLPLIIYRISATQLSKSDDYISGWSTSDEIREMRSALEEKIRLTSAQLNAWSRMKIFLQDMGFPSPLRILAKVRARKLNKKRA